MTTVNWKFHKSQDLPGGKLKIVDSVGWQIRYQTIAWCPPTDLFEQDSGYIVRVEIAGMQHQDISIHLENNYLIISGNRSNTSSQRAYHQMEVRFGEFSTTVSIPGPIHTDKVGATYSDGFLIITLPKA